MTALEIANYLIAGAERARAAGDDDASVELALAAAQFVALARLEQGPTEYPTLKAPPCAPKGGGQGKHGDAAAVQGGGLPRHRKASSAAHLN